jgi:hypothetical protein
MSDEYGYERQRRTDHHRVVNSGAWLGFGLGVGMLGWLNGHMPHVCGFLLDWAAVLAVCYVMAAWKRAWYAWAAFWGMAALCVLGGIFQLLGLLTSQWSTGSWVVGCGMCFAWYWLVRIPRWHPAPAPRETHIIHHIIHHGDARQALPGWADGVPAWGTQVIPGTTVTHEVAATAPKAIGAPAARAGAFTGSPPEVAALIRKHIRRTAG